MEESQGTATVTWLRNPIFSQDLPGNLRGFLGGVPETPKRPPWKNPRQQAPSLGDCLGVSSFLYFAYLTRSAVFTSG